MQLCVCVSASVFGVSARASAKKEQLLREEETQLLLLLLLLFVQADKEADTNMQIVLFVLLLLLRDKLFANWATPWTFYALPLSPFIPLTASLSVPCFLCLSLI